MRKRKQTTIIDRRPKVNNCAVYKFPKDSAPVLVHEGRIHVDVSDKLSYPKGVRKQSVGKYVRIGNLLGEDVTNQKLIKSALKTEAYTLIHYGAPAKLSGVEMCYSRSVECSKLCLNTAGNGSYPAVQIYRIAKTRCMVLTPDIFWKQFRKELKLAVKRLPSRGKDFLAVRPNGTTDQCSEKLIKVIKDFPTVRFYDYTAVPNRLYLTDSLPNYDVTLSRKETKSNHNWLATRYGKQNVAVVVTHGVKAKLLKLGKVKGIKIVDFDKHDLRLPEYDGQGVVGVLTPKGKARGVESGFIVSSVDDLRAEIN